jgi:hypothetical protein
MLSEAAIKLIADVFGHRDLFRDLPRIARRTVLWGADKAATTLAHSAVVVSEESLLDSIRPCFAGEEAQPEWNIFASRPLPPGSAEESFGARMARATQVELKDTELAGCWIESKDDGWMFLIGIGPGKGWLLSVGAPVDIALERSRLISKQIAHVGESGGEFPAFPRMIVPLCGAGAEGKPWLACGTAALAFDPLCGDGTAHAVREAILATAVIRAISAGENTEKVFAHYEARLTAGLLRHLANCAEFYRTGGEGPWWKTELQAVERGLVWCSGKMSRFSASHYRLNGYELEAVA